MNSGNILNNRIIPKNIAIILLAATIIFALSACGASDLQVAPQRTNPSTESDHSPAPAEPDRSEPVSNDEVVETGPTESEKVGDSNGENAEETIVPELKMKIDGRELTVIWEDNESVRALAELASASSVTVEMSMYGGFEQVGSLGTSIPRNDIQTTTQKGDIVLYSGNQIVVFYESNSWSYTRLGRIDGLSNSELEDLLGSGEVELILFTE